MIRFSYMKTSAHTAPPPPASPRPVAEAEPERFDAFLMERIAHRDRHSFDQLHTRLAGAVYTTAYRVLNNSSDAEEVSQDVFSQIWEKASLYEAKKGKPLTWAATMARNRAIDRLRSNQRRCRLKEDYKESSQHNEGIARTTAFHEARAHEEAANVRRAMAELTVDQREAIELVYLKGMTQKEAAQQLHQPVGTVKARIRRGIAKLRTIVEPPLN